MDDLTLGAETRAIVTRMEHVHLTVADLARSLPFYERVFGFRLRYDGTGPSGRTVHVGSDRFYVAMTERAGLAPSAEDGTAAVAHVGFTTPDLDGFRRRLEQEGVEYTESTPRKEGHAVYFLDPDRHEFEVVGYADGYVYA